MFANMYLAYESLSPGMRAMLDGLKVLNSGDKKRGGGTKNRAERYSGAQGMKLKDPGNIQTDSVHPLVRTHADTGRKGLYLGSHTQHLDGFTPEERSEEHTSELQSLMRISYAVFCLKKTRKKCKSS